MRKCLLLASTLLLLDGAARAQSFNLDIEHAQHAAASLPDAYGGEPFQQGRWQKVVFPATGLLAPTPLMDVHGVGTGVTIESDKTGQANSPNCGSIWLPDDRNLYDGVRRLTGSLAVRLSGLSDGWYGLYVYGVDEQGQGLSSATRIRVSTAGGGMPVLLQNQAVCAAAHQSDRTFVATTVRVVGGELSLRFTKGASDGQSFALSAIQLDARVGSAYCPASANSTGAASSIHATATQLVAGVASVGANDLTLAADNVPPGAVGFFFYSLARHPGTGGYGTFGSGYRCLLGALGRLPVANTQLSPGFMLHTLDNTTAPDASHLILAGSTWHFQGYYADPAAGGFNLSNAVTIAFGL